MDLLSDRVSTLLSFSTALSSSVSFLPSTVFFFIGLDSKCNNGAACMICGLLLGNVILLREDPIKVRLWRGEVSIYSVCQE